MPLTAPGKGEKYHAGWGRNAAHLPYWGPLNVFKSAPSHPSERKIGAPRPLGRVPELNRAAQTPRPGLGSEELAGGRGREG